MIKTIKILATIAVVAAVITIILSLYMFFKFSRDDNKNQDINGHLREELFNEYFQVAQLEKLNFAPSEQMQLDWILQETQAPDKVEIIARVMDVNREIFVSETEPIYFIDYDGTKLVAPNKIGNYELWVYLLMDNGEESLISMFPFTVSE